MTTTLDTPTDKTLELQPGDRVSVTEAEVDGAVVGVVTTSVNGGEFASGLDKAVVLLATPDGLASLTTHRPPHGTLTLLSTPTTDNERL